MPDGLSKMEQVRWKRAQMKAKADVLAATAPAGPEPRVSTSVQPTPSPPAAVPAAVA
eukprot:COSAG06_NODE_49591_length_324_cov_0.915556_1_plen_56_part_10